MVTTIWKGCLLVGGLLLLTACATTSPPPGDALLTLLPAQDRQDLRQTPGAHAYLKTLLDDPATKDIRRVQVSSARVTEQTQTLSVPLPDGSVARFKLLRIKGAQAGLTSWIGDMPSDRRLRFPASSEMVMDPFNWISLLREGDQVVGDIHVRGQAYRLEPVGAGQHVLVTVDESKRPPEAEPIIDPQADKSDPTVGKAPSSAHSTIRVLFVTTNQSRSKYPNNRLQLAQALQNANLYMANSQVAITYELAGIYDATYDETGRDYSAQLYDVRSNQTELGKAVYVRRDALGADLVSLFSTANQYCGLAYVTANKATGYSVISCTSSLGHELGHNLGATHNYNEGDKVGNPPYMFGYRYTGNPRFRTQMSYDCSPACPRIPYHSNPRVTYQGIAVGTVAYHDAARRFNERRETVERFYPQVLINVTVYDHPGMQGDSCTFDLPAGNGTTLIEQACGTAWKYKVWSARVKNMVAGKTLRLGNDSARHSYTSIAYGGDFDVPTLSAFAIEMPNGMFVKPHDGNLTKSIYRVEVRPAD